MSHLLSVLEHRLSHRYRTAPKTRVAALSVLGIAAAGLGLLLLLSALISHRYDSTVDLPAFGVVTELFLLAFLIYLSVQIYRAHSTRESDGWAALLLLLSSAVSSYLLYRLLQDSSNRTLPVSLSFTLLLGFVGLCMTLLFASLYLSTRDTGGKNRGVYASRALLTFLLGFSLFISGPMTILREWRSSYMIFNRADIQAADYIRENTDAHGVFLADCNWHLNAVSVLTGRSIVCGPDLFLYYHGIDTSERKADISAMFDCPRDTR